MYNKKEIKREKEKRMVICSNCGGNFEKEYSYCPYCGFINETSAEKQYENQMRDISKELEELPGEAKEIYERTTKKEIHKILRILLFFLGGLFCLFLLAGIMKYFTIKNTDSLEAEIRWEKEYFPILDKLYEDKDYDGILQFEEEHYADPGECFYRWKYYEFIDLYTRYKDCKIQKEKIQKKIIEGRYPISILIYDSCQLVYYREIYPYQEWEKEQEELLRIWQEEMKRFLQIDLALTEEEIEQLEECIKENGYLTYSLCEKIEKKIEKR